jgi:hypothetical protein
MSWINQHQCRCATGCSATASDYLRDLCDACEAEGCEIA